MSRILYYNFDIHFQASSTNFLRIYIRIPRKLEKLPKYFYEIFVAAAAFILVREFTF